MMFICWRSEGVWLFYNVCINIFIFSICICYWEYIKCFLIIYNFLIVIKEYYLIIYGFINNWGLLIRNKNNCGIC